MGITPDRHPGPLDEEEIQLEDRTPDGPPSINGAIRYYNGDIVAKIPTGVKSLTAGGSGISEATHRVLRQLIHFIDDGPAEGFASGAYKEILPAADPFPTSAIWWESSSKLKKIVELTVVYSGPFPTSEEWKIYDTDGSTVLATVTDAISYSGPFETSRTRTIVVS
jgi:hypothetical protein